MRFQSFWFMFWWTLALSNFSKAFSISSPWVKALEPEWTSSYATSVKVKSR